MSTATLGASTLLSGTIENYRKRRELKDFAYTAADRKATGIAVILAALAGQGGAAVAGLSAMNIREEADFVEFELNGEPVKGWLTFSPFKEGDHVEILAVREESALNVLGIVRDDCVVALHPRCSRGRYAHFKASARWWLIIFSLILMSGSVLMALTIAAIDGLRAVLDPLFWTIYIGGGGGLFLLLSSLIAINQSRKFMPAVRLAESIFTCFGWKNVRSIDLPAITKKYKEPGEGLEVGMLYFRCGKDSLDERLSNTLPVGK
ncbi:putative type VI secretion system effector [Burkholderia sp. S171]|jgi:hypothetical protein|uniref:putative type VI secretion system effector n=1 Tax=Burkholderia sp. S171 TaxID=1641860 RepID=UPI00131AFFF4|nr:putative type VI secretion system effector [Burkholderia sp. S171]